MSLPNILTKEIFSKEIEVFVLETGSDYVDAVITVCMRREIEPETAAKLLNTNVRLMIEKEASDLNLLTDKTPSLEFK